MFRAVSFDAGNTILYCDPTPQEIYAEALGRHGRPVVADEVAPVFRDAWAEMQRRTAPDRDRYSSVVGGERAWWGEFLREILHRLDHDAPWQDLLDELYAAFSRAEVWRVFPDTISTLERLRDLGLRLAVISNWDKRLPEILNQLSIAEYFDVVTVSSLEGIEKPNPEIFRRTLCRLDTDPEHTLHVGDSPREDYQGARDAHLEATLIDRRRLFIDQPYRRIDSLQEVSHLIDEAHRRS